jgi:hypothetical protein
MRKALLSVASLAIVALPALAQDGRITVSQVHGAMDSGWVVAIPAGSNDYFNVAVPVSTPALGNFDQALALGLDITGVCVSVADFSSSFTYPIVGVFETNSALSNTTPDLTLPVGGPSISPPNPHPPLFDWVYFQTPKTSIPVGSNELHAVVQFPPGDSGTLGVGSDSNASAVGTSAFTTDGYTTPAIVATFIDMCLAPVQANSGTSSCKQADRKPHGRLRGSNATALPSIDRLKINIRAGDILVLKFFGTKAGDKWRLYFAPSDCNPAIAIGPVLPTIGDGFGGSTLTVTATWPAGFGGNTFYFTAVWGNPACTTPGVGFTNCICVCVAPDPTFGIADDCTVETGWVVAIPAGPSDYFNNAFGNPGVASITGLTVSVLDFVTATAAYPTAGVSNPNLGVDGSGNTPDVAGAGLLACVCPFTFPSGTFATTCAAYISHAVSIPGGSVASKVHGWVQFPPGDSGLLGVGGDTTAPNNQSFFTQDAYTTPAIGFGVNWGIRLN